MLTTFLAFALQAAPADVAPPPLATAAPMPAGTEVQQRIETADAKLFYAAFEGCTPGVLTDLMLPDYRMIHDIGGLVANNREAFVEAVRQGCVDRAPGGKNAGYKNRRLAVPGTRTIRRMGDWGVVENGDHVFFEWRGEEAGWKLVGGASYTHVWQWMPGEQKFRLSESISYDHGAALPYPPE